MSHPLGVYRIRWTSPLTGRLQTDYFEAGSRQEALYEAIRCGVHGDGVCECKRVNELNDPPIQFLDDVSPGTPFMLPGCNRVFVRGAGWRDFDAVTGEPVKFDRHVPVKLCGN